MKRARQLRIVTDEHARTFAARLVGIERKETALRSYAESIAAMRSEWESQASAVASRFGLNWRALDLGALDVLDQIVVAGEHWRWVGRTNNKGLPVMRYRNAATPNTEWSAHRLLHRLLCPEHEPPGAMRSRCSAAFLCVRPSHRCPTCEATERASGVA